jgi:hypothetical protein
LDAGEQILFSEMSVEKVSCRQRWISPLPSEQNRYVDIYNLIITEPYNREYVYQTVLGAPAL